MLWPFRSPSRVPSVSEQSSRLRNFPVAWFAVVMGLSGLTLAWNRAETLLPVPLAVSCYLRDAVAVVFVVLGAIYAAKLARHPAAVAAEFRHPVKLSFFPAFSIALLLTSMTYVDAAPAASRWLWMAGAAAHLLFTLHVLSAWTRQTHHIQHISPAWFIPVVGNILVPIAGVRHAPAEVSWFFFAIGLLFWLVLLTIIFYRLIFHEPLPERLTPTLFILIAPPAVGFVSYYSLTGQFDPFARVLYYVALFLTLLLFTQWRRFARLRFFISWWAYSFPLAAITIATLLAFKHTHAGFLAGLAWVLLAVTTLVIGLLAARTAYAVARREICVEEG